MWHAMLHVQAEPLQTICAPSSDFVEFQLVLYVCEFLLCQGGWHMHQWISFVHFTQVSITYMWSESLWTTHSILHQIYNGSSRHKTLRGCQWSGLSMRSAFTAKQCSRTEPLSLGHIGFLVETLSKLNLEKARACFYQSMLGLDGSKTESMHPNHWLSYSCWHGRTSS